MPWKETADPYKIWISEIILQQTRVSQGLNYYLKFIQKFPDVHALAKANQEEVLKTWEGLGYYSRARNLHAAAQDIEDRFNGEFPQKYEKIISLKGIGPYTAAAISSFAFGGHHAVVDGNVQRVLSRYFGITEAIDSTQGKMLFAQKAQDLLHPQKPADHNQAIMDFGALICTPRTPKCEECYMSQTCYAFLHDMAAELPFKAKKAKVENRYFYYFLFNKEKEIIIQRRGQKGIWAGLYEFPNVVSNQKLSLTEVVSRINWEGNVLLEEVSYMEHKLTHLKLHIVFLKVEEWEFSKNHVEHRLVKLSDLSTFAFPKPIKTFLETYDFNKF